MHAGLRAALATWAGDPILAAPLADSGRAYFVLDGTATAILYASAAAVPFGDAVSDEAGDLNSVLAGQIRGLGSPARPRLVRLRLDPRRIAPPTACLIAGGTLDAAPALLVVVVGALPALRPRPARTAAARLRDRDGDRSSPVAAPASVEPPSRPAPPAAGDRFVWRTDAADRLTTFSGAPFAFLAADLVGRSWAELAEAGHLREADGFLSAVSGRHTFRALPAILEAGTAGSLAVDLSGAGFGRGGDGFSGLGGYGIVRAVTSPASVEPDAGAPRPAAVPVPPGGLASDAGSEWSVRRDIPSAASPAAMVATVGLHGSTASDDIASDARSGTAEPPASVASPLETGRSSADHERSGREQAGYDSADAALSITEHAAFREIARALGARYAGDDERRQASDGGRGTGGAVMPFPAPKAIEPERSPQPDGFGPRLDDLPVALLIHSGDTVLAANRRLLDLTGYADVASLQAAGLARLFRGLPPDLHEDGPDHADRLRVVETAHGDCRPVAVERGPMAWEGRPAACLILRAVPEADPDREQAAERLAQSFRDGHAADARGTLDALDDGVVTLDSAFRIVAMNRAAAGLFACDPREVVGTGFETLFEAAQRDAVRASLEGLGTETRIAAAGGRPLMLRMSGQDGTRVAVLRAPGGDRGSTGSGFDRPAFLGRVEREIRKPVEAIVALADGILAESHGPLGERDRIPLRAIRTAGEHVRGLVSDLIDIATLETGGRALAVRPLTLNDLVSGCVERLQPEAARGRIVLRTSFAPDLMPLEADEPTLQRAALTVIGDAIRATAAGGQVIVSTTPCERGGVALKVRGTGPGIRSAEPANARDAEGGGDAHGTGLHLPLTKALVEANHGHLRISSRGNEDTLVEILLPGPVSRTA